MFPPSPLDTGLDRVLVMAMMLLFWGYAIAVLVTFLRRRRAEFAVRGPLAFGYLVRVLSITAVSATGIGASLRGGDECSHHLLALLQIHHTPAPEACPVQVTLDLRQRVDAPMGCPQRKMHPVDGLGAT